MTNEIVFVCKSINNKNIRAKELNILRKFDERLCFEFGTDEMNIKKRYYENLKTLNEDYEKVLKIKEEVEKQEEEEKKGLKEFSATTEDVEKNLEKVAESFGIETNEFEKAYIGKEANNAKSIKHKITKRKK